MKKIDSINNLDFSYNIDNIKMQEKIPLIVFDYGVSEDTITELHCHNTFEIGICKKGNGIFVIGNKIYSYKPGDVVVISKDIYHRAHANDPNDDLWTFCYFILEDWVQVDDEYSFNLVLNKFDNYEICTFMKILFQEIEKSKNENNTKIISSLLFTIYLYLKKSNNYQNLSNKSNPNIVLDTRIRKAIELMANIENLSITEIAKECCLSESYFRQLFFKQIGLSPKEYQTSIKIKKSMTLLLYSNDTILKIALDCGFDSISNFNRSFKKITGKSPLLWKIDQKSNI